MLEKTALTLAVILLSTTGVASAEVSERPRRVFGEAAPSDRADSSARTVLATGAVSHLLLPTSANSNGLFGSRFKTKISIFNAVNAQYGIRVGLSTRDGEIASTTITLGPGETRTFGNFLDDVFGYYGAGAIDLDSGNTGFRFIVSSQVYVDTDLGRYTTAVQFADDLGNITPSRPGYVVGVSISSSRRTNVGCASSSNRDQTITFQAVDRFFNPVGSSFSFVLKAFGWDQYPYSGFLSNGVIQITATQSAVCFGIEVDNSTNDGTFQLATPF